MGTNAACSRAVRATILQVPILDSFDLYFLALLLKLLVIICETALSWDAYILCFDFNLALVILRILYVGTGQR